MAGKQFFQTATAATALILSANIAGQSGFAAAPANHPNLVKVPLSFEANQGQSDPTVKFLSRGNGYTLFLTPTEAVFRLKSGNAQPVVRMELFGANPAARISGTGKLPGVANYHIGKDPSEWRTGVSTYAKVKYQGLYPGVDAVFYGNQRQLEYDFLVAPGADPALISMGLTGVKPALDAEGNVVLKLAGGNLALKRPVVYQGSGAQRKIVDAAYTISGNRVRFRLGKYDRSQTLVIDPVLDYLTYLGGSGYDIIGINNWGVSTASTQGIAVDSSGNLVVAGETSSPDFPLQNPLQAQDAVPIPPFQTAFVAKLSADGSGLIYSTYLGGSVHDQAFAVAVDPSGSAYVTGQTFSNDFPTTPGAYQTRCGAHQGNNNTQVPNCGANGTSNAFLSKLDVNGSLVYSTLLGGGGGSWAVSVAADSMGQAYIAGVARDQCNSSYGSSYIEQCFPETANALLPLSLYDGASYPFPVFVSQPGAAFVAVFDAAGANLLYSTLYGDQNPTTSNPAASNATYGMGVAVDASFNFYLTGYSSDPNIPTTAGALQPAYNFYRAGYANATRSFVAKFGPVTGIGTGANLTYATYLGGTGGAGPVADDGNEFAAGIAADSAGNAYVTGLTTSYDFPVTVGTPCSNFCENIAFLTKIDPLGDGLVWSTLVGGVQAGGNGWVANIGPPRVDSTNNVYVTGRGIGGGGPPYTGYPVVNPVQAPPLGGQSLIFATKYDPTGSTILFSTLLSSPLGAAMVPGGIDVDPLGNIYLAGSTPAQDLPTTAGSFQPALDVSQANAGSCPSLGNACWDAFVAMINPFVTSTTALAVAASTANAGDTVTFTATVTGVDGNPVPTGTVTFLNGSTALGSATLDPTGTAVFTSSTLAPADYSVTAGYSGDNVYSSSVSPAQTLTVAPIPPSRSGR